MLLILSENAITSDWVEDEVSKAFAEERDRKQIMLFPCGWMMWCCKLQSLGHASYATSAISATLLAGRTTTPTVKASSG